MTDKKLRGREASRIGLAIVRATILVRQYSLYAKQAREAGKEADANQIERAADTELKFVENVATELLAHNDNEAVRLTRDYLDGYDRRASLGEIGIEEG